MKEPVLDIVVLIHDKADWANLCIQAVEAFTRNSFRLILVDMASQERKTQDLFEAAEERGHTVVRLADNRSFSHGVNAGVSAGSSKFVCILNDDAIPTEGWDTHLLTDASPKNVGLVGARSNYAAGAQGGAKCIGDPPYLVFVCVCLRRDVWNTVGPMDEETFDGFSSEDLDYSWRVVKHGFRLALSHAFVLHAGSRTLATTLGVGSLNKNNEKYNLRLEQKWGKEWIASHTKLQKSVLVATYSPQETVNLSFAASCLTLKQAGGYEFSFYNHRRTPIHLARQLVSDYAMKIGVDVLVQLDDDATFPADLLPRLLGHEKPAVCALAYQRKPPYATVAYDLDDEKLKQGVISGTPLEDIEDQGLRRVDVSGFHVSAIRTDVFRQLKAHRCKKHPEGISTFWGGFDKAGEDFALCGHLKHCGIPLYVDTDFVVGHIAEAHVVDRAYKQAFKAGQAR